MCVCVRARAVHACTRERVVEVNQPVVLADRSTSISLFLFQSWEACVGRGGRGEGRKGGGGGASRNLLQTFN